MSSISPNNFEEFVKELRGEYLNIDHATFYYNLKSVVLKNVNTIVVNPYTTKLFNFLDNHDYDQGKFISILNNY